MTSEIKPPSRPTAGTDSSSESGTAPLVREAGREFRSELDRAAPLKSPAPVDAALHSAVGSTRAEMIRTLSEALRSQAIEPGQAIERLIERTLNTGPASSLAPALRAELEALLRAALESDPSLQAMRRDLARGR